MSGGFGSLGGGKEFDEMFTAPDAEERDGHVWLFYGGQGTGKTYTAMSSKNEPVLIIDTELRSDITASEFPDADIKIFEPAEISFEDVDPDDPLEDAIDIPASIDNINNAVISIVNACREGDLEGGTVVVDSATDLWSWTQEWGKQRLMDSNDVDEATFRLENQFDWGMIKNKHHKILTALQVLSKKYSMDVIFTAREKEKPNYTDGSSEHYIKVENRVPFMAEGSARFTKEVRKGQTKHIVKFDKLGSNEQPVGEMVNPTFEDISKALETGEIPDDDDDGGDSDSGGF